MNFSFIINKNKLSDSIVFNVGDREFLANILSENMDFSAFCFDERSQELFSISREGLFFEMNYIINFHSGESCVATRVNELFLPRLIFSFRKKRFGLEGNEEMNEFRLFDSEKTYATINLSSKDNLISYKVDHEDEDLFLFVLSSCFCLFDVVNLMRGRF